jgi:multimeric flavodoxin WrbA
MSPADIPRKLLIVAHIPSANTKALSAATLAGAASPEIDNIHVTVRTPFEADVEDVLATDAIILGTTENLGYMSGALKDFFDRIYYPVLEKKQGLPMAVYIRAGHDGTGTRRAIDTITTGLKWKAVQQPLICRGDWDDGFVDQCRDLGMAMAAGLEAGIF